MPIRPIWVGKIAAGNFCLAVCGEVKRYELEEPDAG